MLSILYFLFIFFLTSVNPLSSPPPRLSSPRVAIVGGGIGGLVTAGILTHNSVSCVIIEKNAVLGGRCGSITVEEEGNKAR